MVEATGLEPIVHTAQSLINKGLFKKLRETSPKFLTTFCLVFANSTSSVIGARFSYPVTKITHYTHYTNTAILFQQPTNSACGYTFSRHRRHSHSYSQDSP